MKKAFSKKIMNYKKDMETAARRKAAEDSDYDEDSLELSSPTPTRRKMKLKADVPKFEVTKDRTFDFGKTETIFGETTNQVSNLSPTKGVRLYEQDVKIAKKLAAQREKSLKKQSTMAGSRTHMADSNERQQESKTIDIIENNTVVNSVTGEKQAEGDKAGSKDKKKEDVGELITDRIPTD